MKILASVMQAITQMCSVNTSAIFDYPRVSTCHMNNMRNNCNWAGICKLNWRLLLEEVLAICEILSHWVQVVFVSFGSWFKTGVFKQIYVINISVRKIVPEVQKKNFHWGTGWKKMRCLCKVNGNWKQTKLTKYWHR